MSSWIEGRIGWVAISLAAVPTATAGAAAVATSQARDPAYEAARRQGLVGERVDGYLGFVVPPSPELRRLVRDINIKRKALFIERAKTEGVTAEAYAFTAGCIAIGRTAPGEKYQAPDGTWQTRGLDPPIRDSRCP
ncbi:YdbL family protein [Altererythrobacter sp. Root672]|uniref:YdbL family protein n=1 Tax=Altererythrobacter sp. Root672 TaxID=1736584 RepID=UPI0006FBD8F4|nr:YdbL family protein [Altererythrobacter sp. Root672]KRA84003.1 hypothetical protein ASD76_08365 [Altererythrobacter sp. Root672]